MKARLCVKTKPRSHDEVQGIEKQLLANIIRGPMAGTNELSNAPRTYLRDTAKSFLSGKKGTKK